MLPEFEKYVRFREEDRCKQERSELIALAYGEICNIYMRMGDFAQSRAALRRYLTKLMPGVNGVFCDWIMHQCATPTGFVDQDGFSEIVKKAEEYRKNIIRGRVGV